MIVHSQFNDTKYLASVFFPMYHFEANRILSEFLKEYRHKFDADPLVVPLPDGAPQDIPRIILRSIDGIWQLDISNLRINLTENLQRDIKNEVDINKFLDFAFDIFVKFRELTKISIGRLAVVINRRQELNSPGLKIAEHFCKEKWIKTVLNRPETIELHAYKQYHFDENFPVVNSWIRHKGIVKDKESDQLKGIISLQQDLNTPQEWTNTENYENDQIRQFFNKVPSEMLSLLKKYYPE